jgi:tryptophan synthase beta chain
MVARLQSVISEEIKAQLLEKEGRDYPDKVIACVGGGSNAAGAFYHFLEDERVELIAAEAAGLGEKTDKTAATTFKGKPGILHASKSLVMQTEDGQVIEPHSISAGLDYPGIGPMHANLFKTGRGHFHYITDEDALRFTLEVSRLEGIIPALETAHAFAVLEKIKIKPDDIIVVNLSGRGDKDLGTLMKYIKL